MPNRKQIATGAKPVAKTIRRIQFNRKVHDYVSTT